jgi:hypothetical protein
MGGASAQRFGRGTKMGDFFRFETMITPILIQILFWLAALACVIAGIIIMVAANDTAARIGGLLLLIFGPIGVRIYAEILIVVFRINDHLRHIDHKTQPA